MRPGFISNNDVHSGRIYTCVLVLSRINLAMISAHVTMSLVYVL